jgi:hypothetical protein
MAMIPLLCHLRPSSPRRKEGQSMAAREDSAGRVSCLRDANSAEESAAAALASDHAALIE